MTNIPIVDLAKLVEVDNVQNHPDWISIANKVRESLGSIGFMYLINHGIPEELISNVFCQTQKFFALDPQVKLKYKKDIDRKENASGASKQLDFDNYFGYTPPGGESLDPDGKLELKEVYDWVNGRDLHPDAELPEFHASIVELDAACKSFLKGKLLRLLAMSLGLEDAEYFVKCCRHFDEPDNYKGLYKLRILHYPALEADDKDAEADGSVRLGEHSDYGFLTLLFQDETGGLEVKNADGEWIEAKPIPGSILVNTGDLIEFWTCGIFPATPHRVVIPDNNDARRSKSRYSVVFFNGPDSDTNVTPLDLSKKPVEMDRISQNKRVYTTDPINANEYMTGRITTQYS